MAIEHVTPANARLLQQIADSIANSRRIVVIAGAGISTNCGIPDFRSEQGLYSLIEEEHNIQSQRDSARAHASRPGRVSGKDLFDASLWKSELSTSVFYQFIAGLRSKVREVKHTSRTHKFLKTLRDKRKLVRAYTQNIDGLEGRADLVTDLERGVGSRRRFAKKWIASPVPPSQTQAYRDFDGGCEVVELHGDLQNLRCTICQNVSDWERNDEADAIFKKGEAPVCPSCSSKNQDRLDRGKRGLPVGSLRPNIVLYGEEHPASEQISKFVENDISLADTCLIFGTSLKVHGLKNIVRQFANAAHSRAHGRGRVIYINNTQPASSVWNEYIDYWVESDCDAFVKDVRRRRPDIWTTQAVLSFPTTKSTVPGAAKTPPKGGKPLDQENIDSALEKERHTPSPLRNAKSRAPLGSYLLNGNVLHDAMQVGEVLAPAHGSEPRGKKKRKRAVLEETETKGETTSLIKVRVGDQETYKVVIHVDE